MAALLLVASLAEQLQLTEQQQQQRQVPGDLQRYLLRIVQQRRVQQRFKD
jgi:hypothetical protein